MGRAGSGSSSSGSSSRSGGGHSVSRSSGGHRVGSSTRAGSSIGSSLKGSSRSTPPPPRSSFGAPPPPRGPFGAPPPPPRRTTVYVNNGGRYRRGGVVSGLLSSIVVLIIFTALMYAVVTMMFSGSSVGTVKSTINRTALTDSAPFVNDCIVDELGWFDSESRTERELQNFYKNTGVQPFIVLHAYDSALTTDAEKEAWAQDYYEANIKNESTFLFVYFAESDTDGEVGYMCYVSGTMVSSVMDSEAIEIFWNYIDRYWVTDMSTDDLFVTVFDRTAEMIMRVSTTGFDVAKTAIIVGGVIIVLILLFAWWRARARREKEKAEETARILNTPMQDLMSESRADELAKKYDEM